MTPLYDIRSTASSGDGVFATRPVATNELIMEDAGTMVIKKGYLERSDRDILAAFQRLSAAEKAQYLQLHEGGSMCFKTREGRIYEANCFSIGDDSLVYLKASKINHSCTSNAELEGSPTARVIALRSIEADEEVTIPYSYHVSEYHGRNNRRQQLQRWEFECNCVACAREGPEGVASDLRRELIGILDKPNDFVIRDLPRRARHFLLAHLRAKEELLGSGFERNCRISGLKQDMPSTCLNVDNTKRIASMVDSVENFLISRHTSEELKYEVRDSELVRNVEMAKEFYELARTYDVFEL